MKKIITLILSGVLVLGLVGCGTKENKDTKVPTDTKTTVKYKDGTYTAKGEIDERGWQPVVELTIKDGKIAKTTYNEFNKDGGKKSEDKTYNDNMKAKSNTSPKEAYPKLEEKLVAVQDVDKVDAVAGATHSSDSFKQLSKKALEQAVIK